METRVCKLCHEEKETTAFYPRMGRCKVCHGLKTREWAFKNPDKVKRSHDKWRAKPGSKELENIAARRWQDEHPEQAALIRRRSQVKIYGLTLEQYDEMEKFQDGKCAICGVVPSRRLDIDHNHTTNKVRELLCSPCNTAIGSVNESIETLNKVIAYLTKHATSL